MLPSLVCAFTGHRPTKLPWGYSQDDARCIELKMRIYDAVETAYLSGCRHFISGMAIGCDHFFCEAVLRLRSEQPGVTLEAAIPFEKQSAGWPEYARKQYESLLNQCDSITLLQRDYSRACMMLRNRYMIDKAQFLIACYGGGTGGTLNTMRYAIKRELQIIQVPI